jgi:hypothetical protein
MGYKPRGTNAGPVFYVPNPHIDWSVLDRNEPALRLYRALEATPMDEWTGYRLSGSGIAPLAAEDG